MRSVFDRAWFGNPWRTMRQMQREMAHAMGAVNAPHSACPPVNIWRNDDGAVISAELPGV